MSYDSENGLGCYTELEIASGIPSLVDGRSNGYLDEEENQIAEQTWKEKNSQIDFLIRPYDEEKRINLSGQLVSAESPLDVKSITIKNLIRGDLDYTIQRFGKKEGIPESYLKHIKKKDFIQSMVKGLFSKHLKISLTSKIVAEVNEFLGHLQNNHEMETPYNRVSKLQNYIHNKARFTYGLDAHKNLPRKQIGMILSCTRANLSLFDIESSDNRFVPKNLITKNKNEVPSDYFGYIFFKCIYQSKFENLYPSATPIINGEYKSRWNVRFMKPISYYSTLETREKIDQVIDLDNSSSLLEIKRACVDAYSKRY